MSKKKKNKTAKKLTFSEEDILEAMRLTETESAWGRPGATLSDKSARKEFGLTQQDIMEAIQTGRLQYRVNYMHGNPWFRLIRKEVDALASEIHGQDGLERKKNEAELKKVTTEIRSLKRKLTVLQKRQTKLKANLGA